MAVANERDGIGMAWGAKPSHQFRWLILKRILRSNFGHLLVSTFLAPTRRWLCPTNGFQKSDDDGKRQERRVADTRSGDDGKTVFQARGCQLGDTAQLSIWWDEKLSRRLSDVRHCPIWLMLPLLPWPSWVGHTMIEFSFWLVTSHYQFGVNNRSASRRTRGTVYGREISGGRSSIL